MTSPAPLAAATPAVESAVPLELVSVGAIAIVVRSVGVTLRFGGGGGSAAPLGGNDGGGGALSASALTESGSANGPSFEKEARRLASHLARSWNDDDLIRSAALSVAIRARVDMSRGVVVVAEGRDRGHHRERGLTRLERGEELPDLARDLAMAPRCLCFGYTGGVLAPCVDQPEQASDTTGHKHSE